MIVQKGALRRALKPLVRILVPRSTRPALSHVRLDANGSELRLTTTDTVTLFSAVVPCEGHFSGGLCAEELLEFLSPCPTADRSTMVEFKNIEHGRVVVATEGAMVEMQALPSALFPPGTGDPATLTSWRHVATWRGAEFADAVGWVVLAVGRDPSRPHLHSVLFQGREVVATDGHRLHVARLEADIEGSLLVDGDVLTTFLDALRRGDEVTATSIGDRVRFRAGALMLDTPHVRATFPSFRQVIPVERDETFSITGDRDELRRAVERFSGKRKHEGIRLIVNGALTPLCQGSCRLVDC